MTAQCNLANFFRARIKDRLAAFAVCGALDDADTDELMELLNGARKAEENFVRSFSA